MRMQRVQNTGLCFKPVTVVMTKRHTASNRWSCATATNCLRPCAALSLRAPICCAIAVKAGHPCSPRGRQGNNHILQTVPNKQKYQHDTGLCRGQAPASAPAIASIRPPTFSMRSVGYYGQSRTSKQFPTTYYLAAHLLHAVAQRGLNEVDDRLEGLLSLLGGGLVRAVNLQALLGHINLREAVKTVKFREAS